jgi:Sulfotransferase family
MTRSTDSDAERERRVPDFFIVGHHKSGTTALYQMLRSHPQIYMPALKEPRYFAPDLRPLLGSNGSLPETWEEYLSLFEGAAAGQRAGEASPSYLRSDVAAGLIAKARPDARIVAILREPASFVRSLHEHMLKERLETETDLAKALAAESIVRAGRRVERYSDHVHYVEQLRRYHAVFAPEQVLVVIYEDFRADNAGTVREVLRHLGVDDTVTIAPVEANPSARVRSARLRSVARQLYPGEGAPARALQGLARLLTPRGRGRERLRALRHRLVYRDPPPPDPSVMLELRRRYKGEVEALSEYLGRDLVRLWGYDRVE